jgi:DNA modification methylase
MNQLHLGDCLEVLKTLPENSVDSIVTDPPYGLSAAPNSGKKSTGGFMGKKWDYDVPSVEIWKECLRVLKPGGYLLAFAGTRTQHRMAVRIEDAGFEIRDMLAWVFGSGFPKSMDIGKCIDKKGGQNLSWFIDYVLEAAEEKNISKKELTMLFPSKNGKPTGWLWNKKNSQGITLEQYNTLKDFLDLPFDNIEEAEREVIGKKNAGIGSGKTYAFTENNSVDKNTEIDITAPATDEAKQWEGWGTALKPALEPITVARKPLSEKTVAENVLKWGTGGINIDACRISHNEPQKETTRKQRSAGWNPDNCGFDSTKNTAASANQLGRFPANLIHDGSDEVVGLFPDTKSQGHWSKTTTKGFGKFGNGSSTYRGVGEKDKQGGSAARFFYCPKTSKKDRGEGNNHPTVKPTELMLYLIKLVTKPEGITLDPFMGSGSTGKAAVRGNFKFIGIEREQDFYKIAQARISHEASKPKQQTFDF